MKRLPAQPDALTTDGRIAANWIAGRLEPVVARSLGSSDRLFQSATLG
jgi:hypothetical protein